MADVAYNRNALLTDEVIDIILNIEFPDSGEMPLSDALNKVAAATENLLPPVSGVKHDAELHSKGRTFNQRVNNAIRDYDFDAGSKNKGVFYTGIYRKRPLGTPEAQQVEEASDGQEKVGLYQGSNRVWMVTQDWWQNGSIEMPDEGPNPKQMPGAVWLYRQGLPKGTKRGRPSNLSKKALAPIKVYSIDVVKHLDEIADFLAANSETYADLEARIEAKQQEQTEE